MASEFSLNRSSASLLQSKSQHYVNVALGPLCSVVVSESSETAKAAAALCIGLLAYQRPNVNLPPAVFESIVAMLISERGQGDWAASHAAEALGALSCVHEVDKMFQDQGVVELLVLRAGTGDAEAKMSATTVMATLAKRRRVYREQCKAAGAVEVLKELQQSQQASVREVATSALKALSQSLADDVMTMCSSTGYFCLVVFCFFVQLGGVHAVMDIIDICGDVVHIFSRITSVRRRLENPSMPVIVVDFMMNDPSALLLLMILVCFIPAVVMWLCARHAKRHAGTSDKIAVKEGKHPRYREHQSWLLGLVLSHSVETESSKSKPEAQGNSKKITPRVQHRYFVSEVLSNGPSRKYVKQGDELLEIDGCDVTALDMKELLTIARGRVRLSVAQHIWDALRQVFGTNMQPRVGRGSTVVLNLLRRKEGKRKYKTVRIVRGNWFGRYDVVEPQVEELPVDEKKSKRLVEQAKETAIACAVCEEDEDEKVCRICQCSEEEAPEQGKLFSPCHCRGTMRYIHVKCLETWRRVSANATSNFQCDRESNVLPPFL